VRVEPKPAGPSTVWTTASARRLGQLACLARVVGRNQRGVRYTQRMKLSERELMCAEVLVGSGGR